NRGGLPVLVHEVSRRALGSATTRDCSRTRAGVLAHVAFHHPYSVGIPIASFRSSIAQPACTPVYASPSASRQPTQNSGPSGSLFLSRKTLSFSTSCRFIPALREPYPLTCSDRAYAPRNSQGFRVPSLRFGMF